MLLINGYTNRITGFFHILPKPGASYWPENNNAAFFVLKDFNPWYINPGASMFSQAKQRYKAGFDFAKKNLNSLRSHILLSGNRLQIVAHSQGVAFAEGIAAFLYEEQRFVTDLLVSIQGAQLAYTPQVKNAFRCRVDFKTEGDYIVNRTHQKLPNADLEITENALHTGFIKYRIVQDCPLAHHGAEYIYMRGDIPFFERHMANCKRQFEVWTAINHALALYKREPEMANLFSPKHIQSEVLKQYAENYQN